MKQLSRIGHTFFIDPDEIAYICLHTFNIMYIIIPAPTQAGMVLYPSVLAQRIKRDQIWAYWGNFDLK